MDEINLWKLDSDQSVTSLDGLAQLETEWQLEEVLVKNPPLLEPGVELVGRQTPAAGGWLDLLGVDAEGRLVVFELKRGSLGRDAVTQVLDYTSHLSGMEPHELAEHISDRSGQGGIQSISDFTAWYTERFADLQRLYPIRMVLVGLGIDEIALRIARFLSQGSLNVEVITFFGFKEADGALLARQVPVQRETAVTTGPASLPIDERRRLLNQYLEELGLADQFGAVQSAIQEQMPSGVFADARRRGVSLQMSVTNQNGKRGPYPFLGIYAAHTTSDAIEISLNTITERRNPADIERLATHVALTDWPHGGKAIILNSPEDWEEVRPHVCEFAAAVYESWLDYRNVPIDHSIVD